MTTKFVRQRNAEYQEMLHRNAWGGSFMRFVGVGLFLVAFLLFVGPVKAQAISTTAFGQKIVNTCEWSSPRGAAPLMTPFDEVIDGFTEIPSGARKALIADVRAGRFVDQVVIRKSGIAGKRGVEYTDLRQMNFGNGKRCTVVTMNTWSDLDSESALIYSTKGADGTEYFLLRPEVCRNWSLVTKKSPEPVTEEPRGKLDIGITFSDPGPVAPVDPLPVAVAPQLPPVEDRTFVAGTTDYGGELYPASPETRFKDWPPMWFPGLPLPLLYPLPGEQAVATSQPGNPSGGVPSGGVPVAPVPEPQTLVLMALGLGLVSFAAKRAGRQL